MEEPTWSSDTVKCPGLFAQEINECLWRYGSKRIRHELATLIHERNLDKQSTGARVKHRPPSSSISNVSLAQIVE